MPHRAAWYWSATSTRSTLTSRLSSAAAIRSWTTGPLGQSGTVSTVMRMALFSQIRGVTPTLDLPVQWKVKR